MSSALKHTRGFTLIEVIIYLALFALLMSGFLTAAFTLIEGGGRDITKSMLQAEGEYVLAKINYALVTDGASIDPATLVSQNMQLSHLSFYQTSDSAGSEVGVYFTLSMRSQEGRVVSEDFFSTTTLLH